MISQDKQLRIEREREREVKVKKDLKIIHLWNSNNKVNISSKEYNWTNNGFSLIWFKLQQEHQASQEWNSWMQKHSNIKQFYLFIYFEK